MAIQTEERRVKKELIANKESIIGLLETLEEKEKYAAMMLFDSQNR